MKIEVVCAVAYFCASVLVGFKACRLGRGGFRWALVSLGFTPFVAMILLIVAGGSVSESVTI